MNPAAQLREAFDRSFADLPSHAAAAAERFLAIRIGGHPHAVRMAEISGLFADKKITPLPGPVAELIGLVTIRGTLLPVYDLGLLLDCPRATMPRWLLTAAAGPVGLAFDQFDGYLAAQSEPAALGEPPTSPGDRHRRDFLHAGIAQPVVHLVSVLETIKGLGGHDGLT